MLEGGAAEWAAPPLPPARKKAQQTIETAKAYNIKQKVITKRTKSKQ